MIILGHSMEAYFQLLPVFLFKQVVFKEKICINFFTNLILTYEIAFINSNILEKDFSLKNSV